MKTHIPGSKLLVGAALILATGLALPSAFADRGSGVTIWRDTGKTNNLPAVTPANIPAPSPGACTDSHLARVTETNWNRTGGRGATTVVVGAKLACTSCVPAAVAAKTTDRNSHGPKASLVTKGTHDCSKGGCGKTLASTN